MLRKKAGRLLLTGILVVSVLFVLSACGGSSGGGETAAPPPTPTAATTVSGAIGSGYSTAGFSDGVTNRVLALPNFGGLLNASSITSAKTAMIANDGSFSLSLENDKNWTLVLEDTTQTDPTERFVGYIALMADSASSLLSLPITASNTASLDLGTIAQAGDTGVSSNTASTTDFNLTAAQLTTLARTDDQFRSVKNLVVNYDEATGSFIMPLTNFEFRGIYNSMDNAYADPADYDYRSYQVQLLPNMPGFVINAVCGEGATKVDLELYPPAGTEVADRVGNIYNSTSPISNNFAECATEGGYTKVDEPTNPPAAYSGDFYASDRTASLGFPLSLEFGTGGGNGLTGDVPDGWWQYEVDGVLTGQFDFASANPWTGVVINAVVPVMRVNRDVSTGVINSVDIKWYRPDDTYTGYVEITDLSVLSQMVEVAVFELEDYSSGDRTAYEQIFFDPSSDTQMTSSQFTDTWYWSGMGGPAEATGIHISYESGGVVMFFSNHAPISPE